MMISALSQSVLQHLPRGLSTEAVIARHSICLEYAVLLSSSLQTYSFMFTGQIPHVMDIILAEFHKDCVYTVPKHISYSKDMFDSRESYFKILGYEGNLDFDDDFLRRVECCVEMYAALIQTQVDGILNPHGLEAGWTWLAAVLNNLPANIYTAAALHSFLRIAGFALYKKYEGQFIELLEVISDNFLKSTRPVEEHGYNYYYIRLEAYKKDKLFLKEPEGWRLRD